MVVEESNFNYDILDKYRVLEKDKRRKQSRRYLDVICAFDIEATRLAEIEQAFMYIWQFQIGDEVTIVGRYWEEFTRLLDNIKSRLDDIWMVIYVHSLSYEFSFLKGIYPFNEDEVFCTDKRKVLKCEMYGCFEFRCSYMLTNMSLDKFLKKYDVENKKLTGQFDYSKIRYPWTPLNADELAYCINDVKGLVQALEKQFKSDGDNLQSVVLTSTGYVRRDMKKAMQKFNRKELQDMMPDVEVYKLLREAFRGGDTLSNRWRTDEIIENVKSVDITSSYPSSMIMDRYPMSKFYMQDTADFDRLYKSGTHALLFRVAFYDLDTKDIAEGHLYLSRDKCRYITEPTYVNGRILRCSYCETTLTDIDMKIIDGIYQYSRKVIGCLYASRYKKLPSMFRQVVLDYYRVKTELKGSPEGSEEYYYYMKNKEKLNSTYGCCVQDIGKGEIKYREGQFMETEEPLADILAKAIKRTYLCYQWGVWTCAHSRYRLYSGILVVTKNGKEPMNFIYSDTDSIKYTGDADFTEYNNRMIEKATQEGAYAVDKWGEVHYMGVYEDEGYQLPNRFCTLGSKKYVLEDGQKNLHITIAGVNKKTGGKELGRLENFKEGFIFTESGGTESVFNDNVDMVIEAEGHKLRITDNVVIRNSTYTLGVTEEYRMILNGLISIKYSDHDIYGLYKVKN